MIPATDFDFGVTALAQQFHQDWSREGTPEDVALAYLDHQPAARLAALADDLSFLVDGKARKNSTESLWFAITMGNFDPRQTGRSGEDLLRFILRGCIDRLQGEGRTEPPVLQTDEHGVNIRRIIHRLDSRLSDCLARSNLHTVDSGRSTAIEALRHCASPIGRPELALRFLLRLLIAGNCSITTVDYGHIQRTGKALGYGVFLLSSVEFLVE